MALLAAANSPLPVRFDGVPAPDWVYADHAGPFGAYRAYWTVTLRYLATGILHRLYVQEIRRFPTESGKFGLDLINAAPVDEVLVLFCPLMRA